MLLVTSKGYLGMVRLYVILVEMSCPIFCEQAAFTFSVSGYTVKTGIWNGATVRNEILSGETGLIFYLFIILSALGNTVLSNT